MIAIGFLFIEWNRFDLISVAFYLQYDTSAWSSHLRSWVLYFLWFSYLNLVHYLFAGLLFKIIFCCNKTPRFEPSQMMNRECYCHVWTASLLL